MKNKNDVVTLEIDEKNLKFQKYHKRNVVKKRCGLKWLMATVFVVSCMQYVGAKSWSQFCDAPKEKMGKNCKPEKTTARLVMNDYYRGKKLEGKHYEFFSVSTLNDIKTSMVQNGVTDFSDIEAALLEFYDYAGGTDEGTLKITIRKVLCSVDSVDRPDCLNLLRLALSNLASIPTGESSESLHGGCLLRRYLR
jgi:hypothetical protein